MALYDAFPFLRAEISLLPMDTRSLMLQGRCGLLFGKLSAEESEARARALFAEACGNCPLSVVKRLRGFLEGGVRVDTFSDAVEFALINGRSDVLAWLGDEFPRLREDLRAQTGDTPEAQAMVFRATEVALLNGYFAEIRLVLRNVRSSSSFGRRDPRRSGAVSFVRQAPRYLRGTDREAADFLAWAAANAGEASLP